MTATLRRIRGLASHGTSTTGPVRPRAACAGRWTLYDTVHWPEPTVTADQYADAYRQAAAICAGCPLLGSCSSAVVGPGGGR